MAKTKQDEVKAEQTEIGAFLEARDEIVEAQEAQEGECVETFDLDMLVEVLQTVSVALKQVKTLFNAADSRGDAFINQITLLDNQIQGLVYQYDGTKPEEEA